MSLHTDAYCKALVLIIKIIIIMEDRRKNISIIINNLDNRIIRRI